MTTEQALRDALVALRYIAYGDILEGIPPSNPRMEADLTVQRIERGLDKRQGLVR